MSGAPDRPRLQLLGFKPLVKGSLRGFADVALPIGLSIHDIPVLVGKNGAWANLPSKPQLGRDGVQKRDTNGKAAYVPILSWRDRELSNRFSEAVVAAVQAAHPDALDDGGEP